MTGPSHVPVLLDRVLDLLAPVAERTDHQPVVVDATLGLGGHTEAMLHRFPALHVIGIDRDPHALELSRTRLAAFGDRVTFVHAVYDEIADVVGELGRTGVDGILFDLGVSSMQLDVADRGFAYAQDAPLDMRMNPEEGLSAADVLNTYSARDLAHVLRVYGEEKFARRIADNVVAARAKEPFTTSARLVELVRDSIPAPARRTGGNPAKRTFQALRIEVNDELGAWERAMPAALEVLLPGGRVVVLAYQSLEDKIAKREMARVTTLELPPGLPFIPEGLAPDFTLVTRGAEQATAEEIEDNPRARSVRLRVVERVAA
ncbi:ribosomal RNA small subunit methyltransferase H [Aeromicrobium sp. Root495]|uniref:16S rRNA (cytosine(1402)-N(4))-methyltransferase RsmH n=1 Tax=Aeromicrobium sp. Root495 TaxID=1736550 RepID=UPI0006F8CC48|nr:16S rRNA (cytosine(1402)-N(4))-methyltransferase RsmH [Aeromicrobium sp. Root495]KQY59021.1 ribosomal RNA small subunit methyltransferase H [Aeromicrobium sp. Root495]